MVRNQDDEFNYRILEGGGRIVMRKHPGQVRFHQVVPSLFVLVLAGSFVASLVASWAGAPSAGVGVSYGLANLASASLMASRGGCARFIRRLGAGEMTPA